MESPHFELIDDHLAEILRKTSPAERGKHLRDIAGILKFSGDLVDRAYVSRFAAQLGGDDVWQAALSTIDKR